VVLTREKDRVMDVRWMLIVVGALVAFLAIFGSKAFGVLIATIFIIAFVLSVFSIIEEWMRR